MAGIGGVLTGGALTGCAGLRGVGKRRPNIVVIMADDMGYADASFMPGGKLATPRTDLIARYGVVCTQAFAPHPYCSPSRAALLTGRYQQRFGHECNPPYELTNGVSGLPLSEVLLPELLRGAGYATGCVGKWHLGAAPQYHPNRRGFDEFFGFTNGGHDYFVSGNDPGQGGIAPLMRNSEPLAEHPGYLTDVFAEEAAGFIARHGGQQRARPFFLYLALNAPHSPLQAPEQYLELYRDEPDEERRQYCAMVAAMDAANGRVLEALEQAGVLENTLIFFLNDNGGETQDGADNGTLRGRKGEMYDGGVRSPFAVRWDDGLEGGEGSARKTAQMISAIDIAPTCLAAAGIAGGAADWMEGMNLLPVLRGEAAPAERTLFWRMDGGTTRAARDERFKWIQGGPEQLDVLFDLENDPSETRDVKAERPEDYARLAAAYAEWDRGNIAPRFPNG